MKKHHRRIAKSRADAAWENYYANRPCRAARRTKGVVFRRHFYLAGGICMHATKGTRPMFNRKEKRAA